MTHTLSNLKSESPARWLMVSVAASTLMALAACSPSTDTPDQDATATSEAQVSEVMTDASDMVEEASADMSEAAETASETSETRQADAHVHGAAELAMALDGATLTVELESPLYNILGFEHSPETDAQKQRIASAEAALSDPTSLFSFTGEAGCAAEASEAVKLFADASDEHSHDHDDHGHDDDHSHDHSHDYEDHGHDHNHDGDDHDHAHKDALLTYRFVCENPNALAWVETTLFEAFPNMESVELVYLGPATQMSKTLTNTTGRVQLAN